MKLYVGNLSYNLSETDLHDLFKKFGSVENVKIITDRYSGQSKGFAFVEMGSRSEAQLAIEGLNGSTFHDRQIVVNEARPQEKKSFGDRPGFRGNRGGGGGRGDRGDRGDRGGRSQNRW